MDESNPEPPDRPAPPQEPPAPATPPSGTAAAWAFIPAAADPQAESDPGIAKLAVTFGLCLLTGLFSLVLGPYTPKQEKGDGEVEILGRGPFDTRLKPDGVALVHVYGAIGFADEHYGQESGGDRTVKTLRRLREVDAVKAVVLRVNSPGGTVAASQEIAREVEELRRSGRKVVVSMADMAASGGFYISAPADYVYANGGTLTGSIGVITQLPRFKELADKVGVTYRNITSGPFKDMGNPFRDLRDDELRLFETTIMEAYLQFVEVVARGRGRVLLERASRPIDESGWRERLEAMQKGEGASSSSPSTGPAESVPATRSTSPPTPVRDDFDLAKARQRALQIADGRIYIGIEAVRLGLVDEVGTLQDALDKAGQLAGLGKNPTILKPKGASDYTRLMRMLDGRIDEGGWLASVLQWFGIRVGSGSRPLPPMPVAYLYSPGG